MSQGVFIVMYTIHIYNRMYIHIYIYNKVSNSNDHNEPRVRWSRLACFDGELVVSSNCSTEGDTSMDALKKVDETWVIRPMACFNN